MGYAELGYEGQHPPYVGAIPANPTIKTYYEEMNIRWHKTVQTAIRQIN